MFKHCMEIVHNHGNVVLPERFPSERVNSHNVFSGKGFTTEGLFRSLFDQVFL